MPILNWEGRRSRVLLRDGNCKSNVLGLKGENTVSPNMILSKQSCLYSSMSVDTVVLNMKMNGAWQMAQLLRLTHVLFPAPTWQLRTLYNSQFCDSVSPTGLWRSCLHMVHKHTCSQNSHRQAIKINFKFKKGQKIETWLRHMCILNKCRFCCCFLSQGPIWYPRPDSLCTPGWLCSLWVFLLHPPEYWMTGTRHHTWISLQILKTRMFNCCQL